MIDFMRIFLCIYFLFYTLVLTSQSDRTTDSLREIISIIEDSLRKFKELGDCEGQKRLLFDIQFNYKMTGDYTSAINALT